MSARLSEQTTLDSLSHGSIGQITPHLYHGRCLWEARFAVWIPHCELDVMNSMILGPCCVPACQGDQADEGPDRSSLKRIAECICHRADGTEEPG